MDAETQAMDGIQSVAHVLDSDHLPTYSFTSFDTGNPVAVPSLPSLDAGFRHPCRNDEPPTFNDESRSLETNNKKVVFRHIISSPSEFIADGAFDATGKQK